MKKLPLVFLAFTMYYGCQQQVDPLTSLLKSDHELGKIALDEKYEVQIIYTQIDRDSLNQPSFRTFSFNTDKGNYFYPASTVKLPAVLVALEKLGRLGIPHDARIEIDSAYSGQSQVRVDSTDSGLEPSIGHYARKILLVSDNDAYNRLYEFIGQDEFNETMQSKGYTQSRFAHRLSIPLSADENAHTNPMRFYVGDSLVYQQPAQVGRGNYRSEEVIQKGSSYLRDTTVVYEPFDFTSKNNFPLMEQHELLQALIFPGSFPERAFQLRPEDRALVLENMSILPRQSGIAAYEDSIHYWDAYAKFLMYGSREDVRIPDHIRIYNKIGLAYGFAIDNAYIIDTDRKVEFLLSATILANKNERFNDGQYEYDEISFPFFERLGQQIYQIELDRKRDFLPDFTPLLTF